MVGDHGDTGGRPGCTSSKFAARNAMGRLVRFLFFCHGIVHLRCDSAPPTLPDNSHRVRRRAARAYWKRYSESTAAWSRLESLESRTAYAICLALLSLPVFIDRVRRLETATPAR